MTAAHARSWRSRQERLSVQIERVRHFRASRLREAAAEEAILHSMDDMLRKIRKCARGDPNGGRTRRSGPAVIVVLLNRRRDLPVACQHVVLASANHRQACIEHAPQHCHRGIAQEPLRTYGQRRLTLPRQRGDPVLSLSLLARQLRRSQSDHSMVRTRCWWQTVPYLVLSNANLSAVRDLGAHIGFGRPQSLSVAKSQLGLSPSRAHPLRQ